MVPVFVCLCVAHGKLSAALSPCWVFVISGLVQAWMILYSNGWLSPPRVCVSSNLNISVSAAPLSCDTLWCLAWTLVLLVTSLVPSFVGIARSLRLKKAQYNGRSRYSIWPHYHPYVTLCIRAVDFNKHVTSLQLASKYNDIRTIDMYNVVPMKASLHSCTHEHTEIDWNKQVMRQPRVAYMGSSPGQNKQNEKPEQRRKKGCHGHK